MFSQNQKLSPAGIKHLMISEYLGSCFLFAGYFSRTLDFFTGIFILTAIFLCCLFYLYFITNVMEKSLRPSMKVILYGKIICKTLAFSSFSILFLIKSVHELLLPNTNVIFLCLFIFFTAIYIAYQSNEVRCRLCEIILPFVVIAACILLLTGIFRLDFSQITQNWQEISRPRYQFSIRNGIKLILTVFFSFLILCPADYLLIKPNVFHTDISISERRKLLAKNTLLLYLFSISQFILSSFLEEENKEPEIFFSICVCTSVLLYIGASMHYGTAIVSKNFLYPIALFVVPAILLFCPVYLNTSYIHSYLSKSGFETLYTSSQKLVDARELENRTFVLSMIISNQNANDVSKDTANRFQIILETAAFDSEESFVSRYVTLQNEFPSTHPENGLNDLLSSFEKSGGKPLDFSHIQAIILNLENQLSIDAFFQTADTYRLPKDTLIFQKKDFPQTYEKLISDLETFRLGEVLTTLAKNQEAADELMLRNFSGTK